MKKFNSFSALCADAEASCVAESNTRKAAHDAKAEKGRKHYMKKLSKRQLIASAHLYGGHYGVNYFRFFV